MKQANRKAWVEFDPESAEGAELMNRAVEIFRRMPYPSICTIERELRPGYAISAAIMSELERREIVSKPYGNGERRFFGDGEAGRAAFLKFAEEIKAGTEPAAHWWNNLGASARRKYMPGAEALSWGDLPDADRRRARLRYWKNLDALRALQRQFAHATGYGYGVAA